MKRTLDVTLSLILLLVAAPILVAVALAIRLTSRGPILHVGERVGLGGKTFGMYKFRSMREASDASAPAVTANDDPRITRLGRALRVTKLDELPQLVNVLQGQMSLVGPRPEAPTYIELYGAAAREILSVPPGITGPTQLHFIDEERLLAGGEADRVYREELLPRKIASDLQYVRSRSFTGDVRILLLSVARLLRRRP
jgi:lipopolysaccharide/colanic/teichoic acid biosynthesis glycosyltransferase